MRAIGLGSTQFMGARVAGELTYIPAHTKNGKLINQRTTIPVYLNSNKGTNRDGTPGRSDQYRLVAWGKLADICAKSLAKGKALDCNCTPHSYEGRIYDGQGQMRVDNTGQPLKVEKVGFTIDKIIFGEDAAKTIDEEIQNGRRPINWNVPNHADQQLYQSILTNRRAEVYAGGTKFVHAKVIVPSGPGIALANVAPVAAVAAVAPITAPIAPVIDQATLQAMIAQALAAQTPVAPVATAPVAPVLTPQVMQASNDMPF